MSIASQFDTFIAGFLSPEAPDIQKRQLRIAFIAGAASSVREITDIPDDPTPDKAPTRAKLVENIQRVFAETMGEAMSGKFKQ